MTTELDRGVMPIRSLGGRVQLLDQRLLPERVEWFDATELEPMCLAIRDMVVRGAPSIGVAAAFGLAAQARRLAQTGVDQNEFLYMLRAAATTLQSTRPTAVNLRWGTEQILHCVEGQIAQEQSGGAVDLGAIAQQSFQLAERIMEDHVAANQMMGDFGAALVPQGANIMTHCNAGPLATSGWGTALGVIRSAARQGKHPHVFVDETRPRNQGARLTMWELHQDKVAATLICDSMAAYVMKHKKVDLVVVGADRIATNGDTANKIGTYGLAVVARHHNVPFYVAAPLSTIDPRIESGDDIPIEERDPSEITSIDGRWVTVEGAAALNPAFDVTPAELIAGIITEHGILRAPYETSMRELLQSKKHI